MRTVRTGRVRKIPWAGLLAGLVLACGSDADRAQYHLNQANDLLADNRGREALIELHSAARLQPDNVDLSLRVAEISLQYGFFGDAVDFYRDALSLRPEDAEAQLTLAQLLLELDPAASKTRIDELLERNPDNAKAWLVRARASLISGDIESAMKQISSARRIDSSEPEIDRVMALAYEARGRAARARNPMAVPAPRVTQSILRAYDRYLAKDGEYPLMGYLGRARALAQLPGHSQEALDAFAEALDQCEEIGSHHEHVQVAREATRMARVLEDPELEKRAVRLWIDTTPQDMDAWRSYANLNAKDPADHRRRVFQDLIDSLPDLPAAHVLYAQHLLEYRGYSSAVDYLTQRLGQGENDAPLLIGIGDIQNRSQRFADAAQTLGKLNAQFPNLPAATLALGEHQVMSGQFETGATTLQAGLREEPTARGYRMLARAEQQRGSLAGALAAINKAIALERRADPNSLRLKAQIHSDLGQHVEAGNNLLRLQRKAGLRPQESLALALSYYLRGAPGVGRKFLIQLLEGEDAQPQAALEFARWDGQNPQYRPAVRHHLERSYHASPKNLVLLEALTEMDWADGRIDEARLRLNAAIDRESWVGKPYLIRGNFLLGLGEFIAARDDAERALRLDPSTSNEAYDIMTAAYMSSGNLPNLVASMEIQAGKKGLSADRLGLLARLNLGAGRTGRALELYEQSLAQGSDLLFVKNDLAYLLASLGGDLDRALDLARTAADAPGENVFTVDTLGYVYLKRGKPDVAVWQFRQAIADAVPPVPEYYFHLGIALAELGKAEQAQSAINEALTLNPEFSQARQARELLKKLEHPDSPEGGPHS